MRRSAPPRGPRVIVCDAAYRLCASPCACSGKGGVPSESACQPPVLSEGPATHVAPCATLKLPMPAPGKKDNSVSLVCLLVADDLTGACDAAVHFAARGLRPATVLVARGVGAAGARVLAVSTESRDLPLAEIPVSYTHLTLPTNRTV